MDVGNLPGQVLGMIIDLMRKLIAGVIKPYQLELFLKKQNPFDADPLIFWKTGQHLDVNSWTFCTGSRVSGGGVPVVFWDSDAREVYAHWCSPDDSYFCLRSREAVV